MNIQDINSMLALRGKPCVSITIPTAKYSKARKQNPELIDKAIEKARQLLAHTAFPKEQTDELRNKLDSLQDKLEYMRLQEGLAIYISTDFFKIQLLPFTVTEKVVLAGNFEVRDLIYANQYLQLYYLVAISKKRIRLFKGSGRDLQEIINDDFPKLYVEEYEYSSPSAGSSYSPGLKAFERDKSILEATRTRDFFKRGDHSLDKYIKGDMPLFIAGVDEELADFDQITRHLRNIAGKIPGNFDTDAVHPLAETAWNMMKENVKKSQAQLILKVREDLGNDLAADGIRSVWQHAHQGRGLMLLLEKDYQIPAYIRASSPDHLYLTAPVGDYETIRDAASEVVKTVLEKGGGVQIVENGILDDHDHIAMLLRY